MISCDCDKLNVKSKSEMVKDARKMLIISVSLNTGRINSIILIKLKMGYVMHQLCILELSNQNVHQGLETAIVFQMHSLHRRVLKFLFHMPRL